VGDRSGVSPGKGLLEKGQAGKKLELSNSFSEVVHGFDLQFGSS
jgi:hypothetical protein